MQDTEQRFGGRVLLINDMPKEMATPTAVFNLFSLYGEVSKVQIMEKQPSKGLVEMMNPTNAQNCRRYLNGIEVCGEKVSVSTSNKSYLGGHIDDMNFQEFNRGRRGDKTCIAPSPMLFVSNYPVLDPTGSKKIRIGRDQKIFCRIRFYRSRYPAVW